MSDAKAPSVNTNLAPDYYLTNFQFLVDWIVEHYADLLTPLEHDFIAQFQQLDRQSQYLFVRLAGRKGPLFRSDKLSYAEINSISYAAEQLINIGLLKNDSLLTLEEIANQLTKVELVNLFREDVRTKNAEPKPVLVQLLAEKYTEVKTWKSWTKDQFGQIYLIDTKEIINTFLLFFFGNAYQDLTEFVLQDLGLYRYENYQIDHQHRIFKNRDEIEQYQQLNLVHEQLAAAENLEQLIFVAEQLNNYSYTDAIARRRARIYNQLAYEFERFQEYDIAFALYQQSHLPPARERRIRLLEKQSDHNAAWQLLNETLANPINEHELQIATRMAPRLAKKTGNKLNKKSPLSARELHLILPQLRDENGLAFRVEEIVRLHFELPEAPCLYVENHLLAGLFGLWLWPEMFRSLEGAFANPFQSAPLDMYEENFVGKRPNIANLWQLFEQDLHQNHIRDVWKNKHGISNHFVNWQALDETILDLALSCIPAQHLKFIFERLLFDIKNNRSGLPDLIQFFPSEKRYRMIEVKGPGDRIQDNQQRWLNFFNAHNIPAEVCYVSWQ